MTVEAPDLMDTGDIAKYLRVERKTVQNRIVHMPGFPEPLRGDEHAAGNVTWEDAS